MSFRVLGGADAFRRFLANELFPLIEGEYRTDSNRVLLGLSFGGLFGAYDLLSPDRNFSRYLLVSPGFPWDYEAILDSEASYAEQSSSLPVAAYSAIGTEDEKAIIDSWHRFNSQITGRGYEGFGYETEVFEGESHISVLPVALTHGLKWLFKPSGM